MNTSTKEFHIKRISHTAYGLFKAGRLLTWSTTPRGLFLLLKSGLRVVMLNRKRALIRGLTGDLSARTADYVVSQIDTMLAGGVDSASYLSHLTPASAFNEFSNYQMKTIISYYSNK